MHTHRVTTILSLAVPVLAAVLSFGCGTTSSDIAIASTDELRTPPSPRSTGLWLARIPRQCQSNPWEGPLPTTDAASSLRGEAALVDAYFRSEGIALDEIGFLVRPSSSAPGVACAACQCARGDRLLVRANDETQAARLERDHDFARVEQTVLGREAKACNTNPWDPSRNTTGTAKHLGDWAQEQGAEVAFAGFVESRELAATCRACTCARGDVAVALPKDQAAEDKLAELEFEALR